MAHSCKKHKCIAMMFVMILLLAMTDCFKISNKLGTETGTSLRIQGDSSSSSSSSPSQDTSSSTPAEPVEQIEVPLYTTFTIKRKADTTADSEAEGIVVGNKNFQNLMRDAYKNLRDKVTFSDCIVETWDKYFTINLSTSYTKTRDLNDFLSLSSNYNDINQLFSISETVSVKNLQCFYFVDGKWANKIADSCFIEVNSSTGLYKVEASKLIPNKIAFSTLKCYTKVSSILLDISKVASVQQDNLFDKTLECKEISDTGIVSYPDSFQKYTVQYSGKINYDDGSKLTNEDTVGMDNMQVSFSMTTNNKNIEQFNKDNPEFDWFEYPNENQMTVDLLLRSLDQSLTDDSSGISPPRGLSSINYLGLKTATFHSTSGKYSNIMINCAMPDFDFLPLGLKTVENTCLINYGSHTNVTVVISGSVTFGEGEIFSSQFIKTNITEEYTIALAAKSGTKLSFSSIRDIVYPTISTDTGKVLPDDDLSTSKLQRLGISESDQLISNPSIEIRLSPFLFYRVKGSISVKIGKDSKTDASVLTNFINLDGSVFSYVKLTFKSKTSNDAFRYFYDVTSTDGGLKSLDINGFEIITTNRDFDMNKISLLKNEFLDVDTQEDIIAKEGVNTKVYADLINDCLDYTFCRIVKSNKVYSKFEFEGPIKKTTVLSTTMNNFGIDSGITFSDSILQIIIDPENNSNAKLNLVGNFVLITEKDRAISLKSQWDFGSKPNSNITLSGRMLGIYDDVFKVGLIDLSEVKVSGIITSTGNLYEMSLNGLGIFGKNCYSQQELIKNLQSQDSSLKDTIYDLSLNKKNSDGSISVVKNNCKSAYFKVFINSADYSKNHIRGILKFDNSEDIFRTSLDVKSDDHIPQIINNIDFPYGLILDYAYTDSTEDRPMSFKGIMNFMGVNTQGQFNLHSWNNTAKANIILPTIKMGRGNFEFITHDDLFYKYGLVDNADNFDSRNLDIKTDYNSLTQNNTLKFKLERDSLASSQLLLESNIIIFGMVNRTITYLNSDLMSFSIIANPFKGVFNANTTIEVKPVKQIEQETNSVVQMNFTQNDEYFHLEQLTNDLMQEWVSRVIKVTKQAKFLISDYTNRMNQAKNSYTKENDCEVYEQCQNLPTIICDEYAQQATCKKETTICLNMVQVCTKQTDYCTRTNSKGECQQSIKKCDHWDTQCQDETTSKVCSEFESHDIPDHCLKMELVCSTTQQKDQECVSKSREFEVFIRNTQQNIDDLNEFLKNIKQLRDSSVCALRNANDHTQVHKCNEKDLAIDAVLDNLDILDLVTLENVRADMQLDKVIAADQIIFGSDIWLYGDWTNKKLKVKDDLVIKNDVQIEEENIKEGYTNGAKSLITLYHHVDFNSIELTAREMAHEIEKIVCKEFNISNEISTKIQYSIIEFNLIDGNSTICPTYSELDLTPTSDGLYSDHREKVNAKKQNTGLNSYRYKYEEGRTSIDVTKERIDNMNTLAFQEKVNSQKEVSVVDAIVSNLDSKPIVPTIPVTEAATEFKINPDDKDTGSNRKDANSINTDSSMQATAEENNYANSVQEKQASIDEEKRRIAEEKLRIEEENKRLAEENRRQQEELRKQQVKRPQIN